MVDSKIALITGANRGIGKEVARQLAEKGFRVILASRNAEKGKKALAALMEETDSQLLFSHKLDLVDEADFEAIVKYVEEKFGRLDVLVNNAGIFIKTGNSTLEVPKNEIRQTLDTNFYAPLLLSQGLLPLLKKSPDARIINVSSSMGRLSAMYGGHAAYRLSKVALNGLTAIMAEDLKESTVKVVAVDPGWVRTDMGGSSAHRSLAEGAAGITFLAIEDNIQNGGFYRDGKVLTW